MNFFPTTYLPNVALHAGILSAVAGLVLVFLKQARHRSVIAITGLLAVGLLPWISALRPAPTQASPVFEKDITTRSFPDWTIATLPAPARKVMEISTPEPRGKTLAPAKFVFPDLLTTGLGLWLAGSVVGISLWIIAWLRISIWSHSLRHPDATQSEALRRLALENPDTPCFRICETDTSPCVIGLWKPKIVLPILLFEPSAETKLGWAVRHELAHFHTGDSRWVVLFTIIRSLNWWNPLAHHLISTWADAREQLCDLHAAAVPGSRADYGEFLIAMARGITTRQPLAIAMAKRQHSLRLKRRIASLLKAGTGSEKPAGKSFVLLGSTIAVCLAAMVSTVRIRAEELDKIDQFIAQNKDALKETSQLSTGAGPMVKLTSWFITTPVKSQIADGVLLSEEQVRLLFEKNKKSRGTSWVTAPEVTTKIGNSASIEITREVPGSPKQIEARGKDAPAPQVGITLDLGTSPSDDGIGLKLDLHYRFVPGRYQPALDLGMKLPTDLDPDDIVMIRPDIPIAHLTAGTSVCTNVGEIEPGRYLQILTLAVPTDRTGRHLDHFQNGKPKESETILPSYPDTSSGDEMEGAIPQTSPRVHGKLRLRAVRIDLPRDPKLAEDERFFKKLYPASDDSLEWLIGHYQLTSQPLEPVEISLNQPCVPWPEFPGINLLAMMSEDRTIISLSNESKENGTSRLYPISSGSRVLIDVKSGDPSVERRIYITVEAL